MRRASDGRVSPRGYQRGSAEQAPAPPERYRRDRPPTPPYDRSRQRPPARGPAPVLLRNKEVDALYELLGWVQEALETANVPWTLTGGSALGAIRSESILFCDDDIDIAIIGRPNVGKARGALKAIRGAYYQDAGGRKGLPWDRIRHKSSPKAWVDVFLLVEYASLDELRKAVSTKRNGEPQATDEIEKATQFCASLPSDAWPLYHFGELDRRGGAGLAIRRWPREVILRDEQVWSNGNFGPLKNVPIPPKPLSYVVRAFGEDCMAVYYCVEISQRVYYVEPDAHGPDHKVSAVKRKQPLREEHYKPVMPFSRSRRSSSTHDRAVLKTKLAILARKEGITAPPLEAVLVASNGPRGEALSSEFADAIIYRYQVGWGASIDAQACVEAAKARGCRFVAVAAAEADLGGSGPQRTLRHACTSQGVELGVFGLGHTGSMGGRANDTNGPLLDALLAAKGYRRWIGVGESAEGLFVPLPPRNTLIAPAGGFMATYVDKGPLAGLGVRVTTHQRTSANHAQYFAAQWPPAPSVPRASDYLVVLCAGVGSRLGLGAKCCVDVGGASIFQRLCRHAKRNAVRALVVVVGYESEKVSDHCREACAAVGLPKPAIISNDDYQSTNTAKSLLCAVRAVPALAQTGFLLVDGDLLVGDGAFDAVARFPGTCAAVSRPSPLEFSCDDAEAVRAHVDDDVVIAIGKQVPPNAQGECVGLYSITGESFGEAQLDLFLENASEQDYYEDAFHASLVDNDRLDMRVIDVTGMGCVEVDTPSDLEQARALAGGGIGETLRRIGGISALVKRIGLEQVAPLLAKEDIDEDTLPLLKADDLVEAGLDPEDAKRLTTAVASLPPPSSSNDSFSLQNVTKALDEAKESADLGSAKPYVDFLARVIRQLGGKAQSARLGDVCKAEDPETYAVIKTNFDGLRGLLERFPTHFRMHHDRPMNHVSVCGEAAKPQPEDSRPLKPTHPVKVEVTEPSSPADEENVIRNVVDILTTASDKALTAVDLGNALIQRVGMDTLARVKATHGGLLTFLELDRRSKMANVRILWVPKNDVVYLEHSTADDINQGGGELRAAAPSFCPAGPTSTTIEPPRTIEHAPIGKPNVQLGAPSSLIPKDPGLFPAPPTEGVARQLELLTADGYAPTQAWPCSRDDAPIIKCVLDCMRAQAPKASTLHKIRAYLRGVYKLPVTVKSVPLRALLTAYPGNFVFLTATSLGERGQKIIAL